MRYWWYKFPSKWSWHEVISSVLQFPDITNPSQSNHVFTELIMPVGASNQVQFARKSFKLLKFLKVPSQEHVRRAYINSAFYWSFRWARQEWRPGGMRELEIRNKTRLILRRIHSIMSNFWQGIDLKCVLGHKWMYTVSDTGTLLRCCCLGLSPFKECLPL